MVADDLEALAEALTRSAPKPHAGQGAGRRTDRFRLAGQPTPDLDTHYLLGNHAELDDRIDDELAQALDVPLFVINEAVARLKDGSITDYRYDANAAKRVKV